MRTRSPDEVGELACTDGSCRGCRAAASFLRRKGSRPLSGNPDVRAVDLFSGCGGMSLGLREAARRAGRELKIGLAVDSDPAVAEVYRANLPNATVTVADVAATFDGRLGFKPTQSERSAKDAAGRVDVLLGGPPCQGHSDLNNFTRRDDPKNALFLLMARAAEVLRPKIVVVENVPSVQRDKAGVVQTTQEALNRIGYEVAAKVVDLRCVGVPQRRQRYVLLASSVPGVSPASVLQVLTQGKHADRTVRWAIEDLTDETANSTYDTAGRCSPVNAERIRYLFEHNCYDLPNSERPKCHRDGGHSYKSMYGRLRWDRPAQTITTGFGSMGQGRYVHPSRRRTLTPHEAARLQTFPDWFNFGTDTSRGVLAKVIGNAVPPFLMIALGALILPALTTSDQAVGSDGD